MGFGEILPLDCRPEAEVGLRSIPSVPLFKDGRVVERFFGVKPKAHYEQVLDKPRSTGKDP